jgi:hypothetical protein
MIPWRLADSPRLQLEFLSRSDALSERNRKAVRDWLSSYNSYISHYLQSAYGAEGVRAANEISRTTAQKMNENQVTAREKLERDLFKKLEEEFKGE